MTHDSPRLGGSDIALAPRARGTACAGHRAIWCVWAALVWISASGAGCPQILQQYTQPVPRALPPNASLEQVINVVNDNSARVQSLSATRATINTPGAPSLSANIAFQRPRSFRLVAQKFVGPEVDLGSNDELLWFWIKRSPSPALFYCRHAEFGASAARQVIPVEPEWLIEALGVVTFDKTGLTEGPFAVGNGRLEMRTKAMVPGGNSRITTVDESRGVVLEEHVYDAKGTRLATAVMSKHALDPASGAKLPRHVDIQFPPANFSLSIDMGDVQVNQLPTSPQELFTKPTYGGYNEVDLAHPNGQLTPNAAGPYGAPPQARY